MPFPKFSLRRSLAALLLVALLLSGCSSPLEVLSHDNPDVRRLQKEHSTAVIPSLSQRKRLAIECGKRVSFIIAGNQNRLSLTSGRAAAISPDGYYLTAYHVVESGPFYLSDFEIDSTQEKKLNANGFLLQAHDKETKIPGRLVWSNKKADLAIIKFAQKTPHYFKQFAFPLKRNSVVFSSDDHGFVALPSNFKSIEQVQSSAVGNGPYFSAGHVLFSQLFTHGPGVHTIGISLIARGGMSGGPIVTLDGQLCGVLSLAGLTYEKVEKKVQLVPRSTARMLPPATLRDIIQRDRAKL